MLVPISKMVNLASVKLNGEPMQAIHEIWYWNELETNFCLVLITIKDICNFFYQLKHEEQTNIKVKLVSIEAFLIPGSSLILISHFPLILDHFQNTYLTLNIHISAKWQTNISVHQNIS